MSTSFQKLLAIAETLNHPVSGCPWDLKQTFGSLQKYILEEACELIDAVDELNYPEMCEELGDLLYVVVFYTQVAKKEKLFTLDDVIENLCEKLIRRHPHIFKERSNLTSSEVEINWKAIKEEEKKERKSPLDGIPKSLAALARAQKVISKLIEHESEDLMKIEHEGSAKEKEIASLLLELVSKAHKEGLDAEKILRAAVLSLEKAFRQKPI